MLLTFDDGKEELRWEYDISVIYFKFVQIGDSHSPNHLVGNLLAIIFAGHKQFHT